MGENATAVFDDNQLLRAGRDPRLRLEAAAPWVWNEVAGAYWEA